MTHHTTGRHGWLRLQTLFATAALLASCGGGGPNTGVSPFPEPPAPPPPPAPATAQACAPSNPYRGDASEAITTGSLAIEKSWLKTYMSAAYLWYDQMPTVDASLAVYSDTTDVYGSIDNYFQALKTPARTASGKRRDQFSFTYPTKAWQELSMSGVDAGYGIEWAIASSTPPRGIRVAWVEPGSPAARAGVLRGDTLVTVDGTSADAADQAGVDALNAGLFPSAAAQDHRFVWRRAGSDISTTLTSAKVTKHPVPLTKVLAQDGRKIGYLVFNDHIAPAESALITAINTLKTAAVDELVLDLRYNGGGFLFIASELAYMVAGPARTAGQVFEQLRYNAKRSADTNSADARTPFYDTSCILDGNFQCTRQEPLPTLGLSRVVVLTGPGTCSASEAIVNGLRGVGVEVVLVGDTTCGKPYGFTGRDNCGITYFPIEFMGVNAQGFGDYADGFAPTCGAADDLEHALGDTAEGQLAAALSRLSTGQCPSASAARQAQAKKQLLTYSPLRGPERTSRIVLPLQR